MADEPRHVRCLIVNGSPRSAGSTGTLCGHFARGVRDTDGAASVVCLGDAPVAYCRGCGRCADTGECVIHDGMRDLTRQVLDCDVLVLASPSYWGDVTAQMKAFIDRSRPLCEHSGGGHPGRRKLGVSIVVRAGTSKEESLHLVSCFEHYFGHLRITPAERLTVEGVSSPDELAADHTQRAYDLGRKVAERAVRPPSGA